MLGPSPGKFALQYSAALRPLCSARGRHYADLLAARILVGRLKPVTTVMLGTIECAIRAQKQRIDIRRRFVRRGSANADRCADLVDADTGAGDFETSANAFSNARHHFHRLGYYRCEFLAAKSADDVARSHAFSHRLRKYAQHVVTNAMTEAVVDRLEMIEIKHQQRNRLAALSLAGVQLDGRFQKCAA